MVDKAEVLMGALLRFYFAEVKSTGFLLIIQRFSCVDKCAFQVSSYLSGANAMAPDAEHADNNRPKCPSALHLTPLSTPSNRDPIHNEEAVISDSSLSQNNSHSIRSTPASSFSVQGGSPNTEAQSSALQPSEEIELSSISRHGSPGENQLQPISEDSSQCQNTSGIVIEGQHGDRGVHQRPVQQRPYTTSLQESLRTVSRYIPNYQKTSTIIALLALALTAFFGYETYVLAKLEVAAQIRQSCDEEKVSGHFSNTPPCSLCAP